MLVAFIIKSFYKLKDLYGKEGFTATRNMIKEKAQAVMGKMKIMIATYQIVVDTSTSLNVNFPTMFRSFLSVFSVLNFDFFNVVALGCTTYDLNYLHELYVITLLPIGISLLLVLLFCIERCLYHMKRNFYPLTNLTQIDNAVGDERSGRGEDKDEDPDVQLNKSRNRYLNIFLYLTYLVLPSVTTTIFRTFLCTNIDPRNEDSEQSDRYLTADMSISCEDPNYYTAWYYALAMIAVYPIGIPLFYMVLLYQVRDEIGNRKDLTEEEDKMEKELEKAMVNGREEGMVTGMVKGREEM
jgi:hypothetical protein